MYYWATRNMEPDDVTQFDARLWMPPKGEEAVQGPWTAAAEMSAFRTLKAQITGANPTGDAPAGQVRQAEDPPGRRRPARDRQQQRPAHA